MFLFFFQQLAGLVKIIHGVIATSLSAPSITLIREAKNTAECETVCELAVCEVGVIGHLDVHLFSSSAVLEAIPI